MPFECASKGLAYLTALRLSERAGKPRALPDRRTVRQITQKHVEPFVSTRTLDTPDRGSGVLLREEMKAKSLEGVAIKLPEALI